MINFVKRFIRTVPNKKIYWLCIPARKKTCYFMYICMQLLMINEVRNSIRISLIVKNWNKSISLASWRFNFFHYHELNENLFNRHLKLINILWCTRTRHLTVCDYHRLWRPVTDVLSLFESSAPKELGGR